MIYCDFPADDLGSCVDIAASLEELDLSPVRGLERRLVTSLRGVIRGSRLSLHNSLSVRMPVQYEADNKSWMMPNTQRRPRIGICPGVQMPIASRHSRMFLHLWKRVIYFSQLTPASTPHASGCFSSGSNISNCIGESEIVHRVFFRKYYLQLMFSS